VNSDPLPTEQPNPRTADLDRLDTLDVLRRINAEDQTVAPAVALVLPDLARAVEMAHDRWMRGGRVALFGAGTSGRLALLDAAELSPTFGIPKDRYQARLAGGGAAFETAVEGAEDDAQAGREAARDLGPDDLAFGLAASGRTPWVLGALAAARERGAATIGLACVPSPALGAVVDLCLVVDTGPEVVAGSTRMKAGTAQKLVLNAFSTALMVRLGKVHGNLMVDVQATNDKLRRRAARLVRQVAGVDEEMARQALLQADWEVKVAILMLRLGVTPNEARRHLAAADGRLRPLLESTRAR
jgi:N-acetylmuramic acid 6-phosphate etherase